VGLLSIDYAVVYADVRTRLTELASRLDGAALATRVPATPEWTVKDAIGHVVGIIDDLSNGNLEGLGSEPWTAAQVEARRATPIADVLAEWAEKAPPIEATLTGAPLELAGALIGDVACHDFDVRGALANTEGRHSDATRVALETYAYTLAGRVRDAGLPSVELEVPGFSFTAGDDGPAAMVRGTPFEMLRALTGRRSAEQIRALDWSGNAEAYLAVFAAYPMRQVPLDE
jgi:uncharacterized protein (TIGR03083 family)